MACDPTKIQCYLEDAECPATGGALTDMAAGNHALEDLLTRLRAFEGQHFQSAPAVAEALTPGSG